ncbi:MAG: enoyl-CoA hydratase/isomerase family protein [Pseudomonadota bacterium]
MFDTEMHDDIAVVTMCHGKANALDTEFCNGLVGKLDELRTSARGVVLTASGSIFSAGVDLHRVLQEDVGYVHTFLPALSRAFKALYAFPNPMVTAINGHALAGGCIIAIAADHRIMADAGATIGVPELRVGVPFPSMALEMIRQVAGRHAERIVYRGERLSPATAQQLGLVDDLVSADELQTKAIDSVRDLCSLAPESFAVTKWQLREQVFLRLHELEDEEREVERIWLEEGTRSRIQAYVDQAIGSA